MRNQACTRLATYNPLVVQAVLQSVHGFSQTVCTAEQYTHLVCGELAIIPNPGCVVCSWLVCN